MPVILFWSLVAVVLYVYVGYPLIASLMVRFSAVRPAAFAARLPFVSLIIAAYNEEGNIGRKLSDSLALAYPRERLEIIVASDGSTDRTDEIVQGFEDRGVRLIRLESNSGKSAAQNRAVSEARGDIVIFSDADVDLDAHALETIVRPFSDDRVGCVTGRIRYAEADETGISQGEDLYWRYEFYLRRKESELGNLAMGSGFLAIRRELFEELEPDVGDDFVLPIKVAIGGHRVVFEPDAGAETVLYQSHAKDMFRTRVRIITKDLRGLFSCRQVLNPFSHPLCAWGLVSHKLLRWLVPYFLIAIFASSMQLSSLPFYRFAVLCQAVFYVLALVNLSLGSRRSDFRLLCIPSSFTVVNSAAFLGVIRFVTGKRSGRWKPVRVVAGDEGPAAGR